MGSTKTSRLRLPMVAQGVRFLLSGGVVAIVYLGTTSLLAGVVGLPFQVALAIGFAVALGSHFLLQRLFVWQHVDGFALPLRHQIMRYLVLAGAQYGITAAATATLPHALGVSTEVVYLCCVAVLSVTNFLLFRVRVFHGIETIEHEPVL